MIPHVVSHSARGRVDLAHSRDEQIFLGPAHAPSAPAAPLGDAKAALVHTSVRILGESAAGLLSQGHKPRSEPFGCSSPPERMRVLQPTHSTQGNRPSVFVKVV